VNPKNRPTSKPLMSLIEYLFITLFFIIAAFLY
jgi:hypothetical protein